MKLRVDLHHFPGNEKQVILEIAIIFPKVLASLKTPQKIIPSIFAWGDNCH